MDSTPLPLRQIERNLSRAMRVDQFRLRQRLRGLQRALGVGSSVDGRVAALARDVDRSVALREARRLGLPRVLFNNDLPVSGRRDEIAQAIRDHQVVIVCGETGSGKSTQLPKICLDLGRGVEGLIGHTQPRRIAARSIAARIAEELGSPLGRDVGFKIRFTDATSPRTYVKLMTDGILLAESQGDRFLEQYDTIILDEAHERSLNIDFLIGCLRRMLPKRPDLKLIITSATIDAARFAAHFSVDGRAAPVLEVSGRTYPVDIRYRPLTPDEEGNEPDLEEAVIEAVEEFARIDTGDILIFMPTERDILETAKALRNRMLPGDTPGRMTEILPLYARLPVKQQQEVFQAHPYRRIVIATNVAESSLTVPGIRYVIDPGTARISRYSARSKTQRLPIEPISQASANQRAGRCGRVAPGICIRLFSEDDFERRDRFTPPEIQRTNLASVILQTKALKLGDIERFPFLDKPRPDAIRDGYKTLFELGALDQQRELTEVGRRLSRLPVDPRIGRMILAAEEENCLSEVLIIAGALETQDPRERPLEKQQAADEKHLQFADPQSDFLGYLRLWDFYQGIRKQLSRNQLRKACRQNFLSYNRMREWADIHLQLLQLAAEAGMKPAARQDHYDPVHRAVLTGLLSHLAIRTEAYEYKAADGQKCFLWPGSGVFSAKPRWVVAAELVETSRRYLRTCARIQARWIEPIADHLVKRSYSDVYWDRSLAAAMALEKVTLFGLTIVSGRRVPFGPVDPGAARHLLIERGLVQGEIDLKLSCLRHNQQLYHQMERLQEKLRRRDLLVGEWALYAFYDQRLPEDVFDGTRLVRWLRGSTRYASASLPSRLGEPAPESANDGLSASPKDSPELPLLQMTQADLVREGVPEVAEGAFPDTLEVGETALELDYRYEPGSDEDGVTLVVPLEMLHQVDVQRLPWLVPGWLEAKVVALIRALPKPVRRLLVPAPETAHRVVPQLHFGEGDLLKAVSAPLSNLAGMPIAADMFQADKIPPELQMSIRVVGADGKTLARGRDLGVLRRQLSAEASASIAAIDDSRWRRDGLSTWDFEELPEEIVLQHGGMALRAYPMLIDAGNAVSLRLADSPSLAAWHTRKGLRRLFFIAAGRELKTQVQWLPGLEKMQIYCSSIPRCDLPRQMAELLADRAFLADSAIPRTQQAYQEQLASGRQRTGLAVQDLVAVLPPLFEAYYQARLSLEQASKAPWQYAVADVAAQLGALTGPDFLTATSWNWLQQYPRYFRAIRFRLEALGAGSLSRDQRATEELQGRWLAYTDLLRQHQQAKVFDPELELYRWMLEEYRVSLFAQRLGTVITVSSKRLDQQWEKVHPA